MRMRLAWLDVIDARLTCTRDIDLADDAPMPVSAKDDQAKGTPLRRQVERISTLHKGANTATAAALPLGFFAAGCRI